MLDSTKTLLEAMDLTNTCNELNAICIGYKDSDLESFKYYNSFLEWLHSKHKFMLSETELLIDLQSEVWKIEEVEREKRINEITQPKVVAYESEKSSPVTEQIIYIPNRKMPFEKQISFSFFGYEFFFAIEIGRKA